MPDAGVTVADESRTGLLALIGGGEWAGDSAELFEELGKLAGTTEVLVVPTAAAYEDPRRAVDEARKVLEAPGLSVSALPVTSRPDAEMEDFADRARASRFLYLMDGSPLHLRSVLKGSRVWAAIVEAWNAGATLVASGAGAMVLGDPMVDPRGGAYTVGLGLVANLAIFPRHDTAPSHLRERSIELRPKPCVLAGIDEATALLRLLDGSWRVIGRGEVRLYGPDEPEGHHHSSLIRTL